MIAACIALLPLIAVVCAALGVRAGYRHGTRHGYQQGRWDGLEEGYRDAMRDGWRDLEKRRAADVDAAYEDAREVTS